MGMRSLGVVAMGFCKSINLRHDKDIPHRRLGGIVRYRTEPFVCILSFLRLLCKFGVPFVRHSSFANVD